MRGRWPITTADQVRAYLAIRPARCPRCRNDLVDLRDAYCPACGESLDVPKLDARHAWTIGPGRIPWGLWAGILVNVALAAAVMGSAVEHAERLPKLSWLAPAVLGAFLVSVQYGAVFVRRDAMPSDLWPEWSAPSAWALAAVQFAGLVLIWI